MRIQDVMTSDIVKIGPEATVAEARASLQRNRIHHLIVVAEKKILGVLSDRDLAGRDAETRVAEVMSRDVATISPRATLRQAAGRMEGRMISCLPVIDRGKLAGIVTSNDLLRALSKGVHPPPPQERYVLRKRGPRKRPA